MTDLKLSEAQERALIALVGVWEEFHKGQRSREWVRPGQHGVRASTLESLERLGLARGKTLFPSTWKREYRPSDEGLALVKSMGER